MKRILIIFLIITIMSGAGGCMNAEKITTSSTDNYNTNSENDISVQKLILDYLNDKYNETFEVVKFSSEFSGTRGDFIRVVCSTATDAEKCVVYGYSDDSEIGVSIDIDGKTYYLTDDYANVILQREYAESVKKALGEDVMVKCQMFFPDHMLTDEEFATGLKGCLENSDLRPQVYMYVLADGKYIDSNLREKAENCMSQYDVYKQYLYVVYQSDISFSQWEDLYYDNYSSFERYLNYDSEADFIEFSSFSLEEGYKGHEIVKGEE